MDAALKEKTRENKRLKDNFETLKMANDAQKKEVHYNIEFIMCKIPFVKDNR